MGHNSLDCVSPSHLQLDKEGTTVFNKSYHLARGLCKRERGKRVESIGIIIIDHRK